MQGLEAEVDSSIELLKEPYLPTSDFGPRETPFRLQTSSIRIFLPLNWASLWLRLISYCSAMQETLSSLWVGKIP